MRRFILAPLAALAIGTTLLLSPGSASADQRDFTLYNNSRTTIARVYVSPSSSDRWGSDWLGSDVLHPGASVRLSFYSFVNPGACRYDVRLVRSDGSDVIRSDVNLCTTTSLTFR